MKNLISIIGPTSVGKKDISIYIANNLNTEIISCDSRKIYKELNIGVAKPSIENLKMITHHFIGILNIEKFYTVGDFEKDALFKINNLFKKYNTIVMVGGSGLYEKAVIEGLNKYPTISNYIKNFWISEFKKKGIFFLQKKLKDLDVKYYNKVDIRNPCRLIRALSVITTSGKTFSSFQKKKIAPRNFITTRIGIKLPTKIIYDRINKRVEYMMNNGLFDEALKLYSKKKLNSLNTIGYKEIFDYLDNKNNITLLQSINKIKKNTKNYAKKQITWYNSYKNIKWFSPLEKKYILEFILTKLKNI